MWIAILALVLKGAVLSLMMALGAALGLIVSRSYVDRFIDPGQLRTVYVPPHRLKEVRRHDPT